jgi:hypothetical protein
VYQYPLITQVSGFSSSDRPFVNIYAQDHTSSRIVTGLSFYIAFEVVFVINFRPNPRTTARALGFQASRAFIVVKSLYEKLKRFLVRHFTSAKGTNEDGSA